MDQRSFSRSSWISLCHCRNHQTHMPVPPERLRILRNRNGDPGQMQRMVRRRMLQGDNLLRRPERLNNAEFLPEASSMSLLRGQYEQNVAS